jgi:ribosomal protein S27AE
MGRSGPIGKSLTGKANGNWRGGRSKSVRYTKIQKERYPEHVLARVVVYRALRSGKLHKDSCELCGDVDVVAHHDDYRKPLNVRWVCRKCHRELHDGMKWNLGRKMSKMDS